MSKNEENPEEREGIWGDPRFTHLVNDPRFRQLPKTARKVKIDKRFQPMFSDDKFRVKYTVDKYGRKVNKSSAEDLEKFYQLESSDSSDEEAQKEEIRKEEEAIEQEDNDALEEERGTLSKSIIKKLRESDVDYSRGEGRLLTDSSSDEESSDEDDGEIFIEHVWGELDRDAPRTDESTRRLAACNMDWDRIRAPDIMVLCKSFLPPGGAILSVKIYPSEYGKQRMAEEDLHGPPELTKGSRRYDSEGDGSDDDEELVKEVDSDAEEGDEYHMEKLRQYQLNRLKYYYAVIEFDSVATADKIYAECDGIEYESSATKLDLRFIPDDTTFEEEPRDVCEEMPDLSKYQPRLFTTTALQQAKVELTWDETNVERKELGEKLASGKVAEVSDAELRKMVAYSSEEESDNPEEANSEKDESDDAGEKPKEDAINKYKALLQEINKSESEKAQKKYEMEYTWGINTKKSKDKDNEKKTVLTPIEKVLAKRTEKNKRRKEERRKKKLGDAAEDDESSDDDMPSGIDMNDPYFAEEFANGEFEDPKKKSKSKKKSKQKNAEEDEDDETSKAKELELLLDDGDEEDDKHHFSLKKIQDAENESKSKKRRKKLKKSRQDIDAAKLEPEDNFQVNLKDDRFGAVYTSHLFNIDPTDPHYKKTKAMEAIIHEKFKRRKSKGSAGQDHDRSDDYSADEVVAKRPKQHIENKILIKNIKKKLGGVNAKK